MTLSALVGGQKAASKGSTLASTSPRMAHLGQPFCLEYELDEEL